jgi:hypothetical protein
MKHLRQICAAVVLTCLLTAPSLAGDMDFPIAPPQLLQTSATGNMGTSTTADSVTKIMIEILQSLLPLF